MHGAKTFPTLAAACDDLGHVFAVAPQQDAGADVLSASQAAQEAVSLLSASNTKPDFGQGGLRVEGDDTTGRRGPDRAGGVAFVFGASEDELELLEAPHSRVHVPTHSSALLELPQSLPPKP